jgi:hypothetical protein
VEALVRLATVGASQLDHDELMAAQKAWQEIGSIINGAVGKRLAKLKEGVTG